MPNCFNLTKKGDTEATALNKVDEFICEQLGVEVHPKNWVRNWYNEIGFDLAMGSTFEKMRATYEDPEIIEVVDILDANFTPGAWAEVGRR